MMRNCQAVPLADIPVLAPDVFRSNILENVSKGFRICSFFGVPQERLTSVTDNSKGSCRLFAVLALDEQGVFSVSSADIIESYPCLTTECPQAHLFEREIFEQTGIVPRGHPWLKPVRFENSPVGIMDFFKLEGAEPHEVAVGPVHAGIIEPGHFRFQCHGENVYHLEISLGYQYRGIENALLSFPEKRHLHYMETLSGDSTIGHATAFAQISEVLSKNGLPPARAMAIRGIALELERLANHTGDLGALANDIGFLPTSSYCGRIRGDFLNLTALLCGNRFGRGLVVPGGAGFNIDSTRLDEFSRRLDAAEQDVKSAVSILWNTPSVMARFEDTGVLTESIAKDLGLVGPAARASGITHDVRSDSPSGIYRFASITSTVWNSGDVFGRAFVRWMEIQKSIEFISSLIKHLPDGPIQNIPSTTGKNLFALSLIEGWRGEICHVAITDSNGKMAHYKITDPSFHNWMGLSMVMRGSQISDFPLCNKSFNLSYCGHDL